jgi:hypothetical protein
MRSPITTLILAHLAAAGLCGCPSSTTPGASSAAPTTSSPATGQAARGSAKAGEECKKDDDCEAPLFCHLGFDGANFSESGHCQAEPPMYEGRPLMVEGAARVAPVVRARRLAEAEDLQLAESLTEQAQHEHASIASFARTLCELLALGAPATLVGKTQRALADEVRHAATCFDWARRLGGEAIAPGPLPEAVAPLSRSKVDMLLDVFWGGCVGESLAAHRAAARSQVTSIDALAQDYIEIADDEARHAALAFETARWMLDSFPECRSELDVAIDELRATYPAREQAILAPLLNVLGPSPAPTA